MKRISGHLRIESESSETANLWMLAFVGRCREEDWNVDDLIVTIQVPEEEPTSD